MSRPGDSVDLADLAPATIVANNDDGIASRVPYGVDFVTVASAANGANDWIILPPGEPGMVIRGWSVPAHEMRTVASSNIKINNVDSDGTQEAAIPATSLWEVTYISDTTGWVLRAWTELGAVITAIVPD